jgi:hypothetical protein
MSDDDILAIVAALEFVASRDETPEPRSHWKAASRDYARTGDVLSPSMASRRIHTPRDGHVPRPSITSRWKNS